MVSVRGLRVVGGIAFPLAVLLVAFVYGGQDCLESVCMRSSPSKMGIIDQISTLYDVLCCRDDCAFEVVRG